MMINDFVVSTWCFVRCAAVYVSYSLCKATPRMQNGVSECIWRVLKITRIDIASDLKVGMVAQSIIAKGNMKS